MSSHVKYATAIREKRNICEVCSATRGRSTKTKATKYCVDCDEKLCQSCAELHENYKISRSHQQVDLNELDITEPGTKRSSYASCDKHKHEQVKVHCMDCQVTTCPQCFIESHNSHKWADVNDMTEEFRGQMRTDVIRLTKTSDKLRQLLAGVDKENKSLNVQITNAKREICQHAQEIIAKVEHDKQVLLDQLTTAERERMRQSHSVHQSIRRLVSAVDDLKKFTAAVASKGTSSEVAHESKTLRERTDELTNTCVVENELVALGSVEFEFVRSSQADIDNAIGKISTEIKVDCQSG
jgi:hypothetical protein